MSRLRCAATRRTAAVALNSKQKPSSMTRSKPSDAKHPPLRTAANVLGFRLRRGHHNLFRVGPTHGPRCKF